MKVGVAVRESVTVAGLACRARVARAFVSGVLGPGHPCGDEAALLVGELFANSIRHGDSGAPGQTVTVAVAAWDGVVRVEVTDRSGPGVPQLRPADGEAEGGRGLELVERLSAGVGLVPGFWADGDLVCTGAWLNFRAWRLNLALVAE